MKRVFAAVGSHPEGFPRMVAALDEACADFAAGTVLAQIGNTNPPPTRLEWYRFGPMKKLQVDMARSNVVVCHAGIGSILNAISLGKPTIVVPRRPDLGEVIDEHQRDTAEELASAGLVHVAETSSQLRELLHIDLKTPTPRSVRKDLIENVRLASIGAVERTSR